MSKPIYMKYIGYAELIMSGIVIGAMLFGRNIIVGIILSLVFAIKGIILIEVSK